MPKINVWRIAVFLTRARLTQIIPRHFIQLTVKRTVAIAHGIAVAARRITVFAGINGAIAALIRFLVTNFIAIF